MKELSIQYRNLQHFYYNLNNKSSLFRARASLGRNISLKFIQAVVTELRFQLEMEEYKK